VSQHIEILAVEPQGHAHLLHLVHEAWNFPQRRLVRLVAVERAELVVVVVLDAGGREVAVEGLVNRTPNFPPIRTLIFPPSVVLGLPSFR
jgi:hypothetical protein